MKKTILYSLSILLVVSNLATAQQNDDLKQALDYFTNLNIDMQWFMSYMNSDNRGAKHNEFALKRGYVNIKKRINDTFSGRITTDLTQDRDGDGEGDVEIRLKYLYLKHQLSSIGFLHKPYLEYGLVHRPWIDFEQYINHYRMQGTMFLERNNILNSADFGVVFMTLFGDEMDSDYKKHVNKNFAGTWGSFSVGVFNGGGYHALEKNNNKSVETRLTIRPLHTIIPGLQLTYHGALGKGNTAQAPDWNYNAGYVSYESSNLILTSEYYNGNGNYKGSAYQDTISYEAVPQTGYSFFGEYHILGSDFSVIGRYDSFTQDYYSGERETTRSIAGLVYRFTRGSKLLVDYDLVKHPDDEESTVFEVALELKY